MFRGSTTGSKILEKSLRQRPPRLWSQNNSLFPGTTNCRRAPGGNLLALAKLQTCLKITDLKLQVAYNEGGTRRGISFDKNFYIISCNQINFRLKADLETLVVYHWSHWRIGKRYNSSIFCYSNAEIGIIYRCFPTYYRKNTGRNILFASVRQPVASHYKTFCA